MMLYTVVPIEQVMQGNGESGEGAPHYVEITLNGVQMQVQPINERQASIVRLFSCNPQHYLDPQYAPGRIIEFQPQFS